MIVDASEEPQNVSKCTSVLKGKYSLFNLEHWAVLVQLLPSKPFIYHKLFSTLAPRVDFFFAIFAAATFFIGFFGSIPLQFSKFGETPLLFVYFETYHYNFSFLAKMTRNTYEDNMGPTAGVYEYIYCIEDPLSYH